ncbi:Chemotaxis protein methyltransferase [Ascidiaceihabitans donghaensis]|uniref:Chemotaxis protein methyltransferase n=1 Tax=Ascidiaceihabitans donghaensis TaxID=1510460 RepID=A0A2R8BP65_9RHOB|nr:Chemotaxis protein methyltransferase [Ascidiaceihabitans donghaensis]
MRGFWGCVLGSVKAMEWQGPEWELSQSDFEYVSDLARAKFGLDLSDAKRSLIYSRLAKRMKALEYTEFSQYLTRLNGPDAKIEMGELLSVLTTNITHFFREEHHFHTLETKVLPQLIEAARAGGRVRLWSAGCSSGQEPFSMAMVVLNMFPDVAKYDFKILATDIDPVVVQSGMRATYSKSELDGLPKELRDKFMKQEPGLKKGLRVTQNVQDLVTFRILNLIEPLPMHGPFDAVFCRNVTIYFDKATQANVWDQICKVMRSGAYLFIGHSERISGPATRSMKKEGFTTLRKE